MTRTLTGFTLAAVVAACSSQASPTDALSSGALETASAAFTFNMLDRCEPMSFNAAVGPGTCIGDGKVTFGEFIAELEKKQTHHQWRFQPTQVSLKADRPITVANVGGETHTFTPVAEFGGGFLPDLNQLSGNPVPAPECLDFGSIAFLPAGSVTPLAGLSQGTHLFECCIHPWMRATVEVHR
jgi:plastocyanin